MMRIIVVEQDAALGQFLARSLRTEGEEVDWVGDGETALQQADLYDVDLMVLNLQLPRLSGLDVLAHMQEFHSACSVIALMAEDSAEARVQSLNLGADDCVTKPFSLQELIARCRAQLRRRRYLSNTVVEHNGLVLNRRQRTVRREGINIDLTAKEFALLEHLLDSRGRCSSRSQLLRDVFQLPETSQTNVVEVYINYLRRKLAPDALPEAAPVIETVRGSGYRIAASRHALHFDSAAAPLRRVASL